MGPAVGVKAVDEVPEAGVVRPRRRTERHVVKGNAAVAQVQVRQAGVGLPVVLRLEDLVAHPQEQVAENVVPTPLSSNNAARLIHRGEDLRVLGADSPPRLQVVVALGRGVDESSSVEPAVRRPITNLYSAESVRTFLVS